MLKKNSHFNNFTTCCSKIQIVESTRKDVILDFSWQQKILRAYQPNLVFFNLRSPIFVVQQDFFADAYTDLPISLWMIADDFSAIVTLFLKKSSRNIFSSCTCTSISRSFFNVAEKALLPHVAATACKKQSIFPNFHHPSDDMVLYNKQLLCHSRKQE